MNSKYTEELLIPCFYTDIHWEMRPGAFLDIAQEVAKKGADELNFGDGPLAELGCAWVVARQRTEFLKPVKFHQTVVMTTWHKGLQGPFFVRDYQMKDAQTGEVLINSTSSWIVMNIAERRVSRDERLYQIINLAPQSTEDAIEGLAPRIVMPKSAEVESIGSHVVRFSDVDSNGHTNNVKYTVWAIDHLPDELVYNHRLKESSICFNQEAMPGEEVEFLHAVVDGAHIVEGRTGDHQVFITKLVFEE